MKRQACVSGRKKRMVAKGVGLYIVGEIRVVVSRQKKLLASAGWISSRESTIIVWIRHGRRAAPFVACSRSRRTPLRALRSRAKKRQARREDWFRAERKTKEHPVRRIARSGVVGHGVSTSPGTAYSETPLHVSLWRATRVTGLTTIIADTSTLRHVPLRRSLFLAELFIPQRSDSSSATSGQRD